jgi:N-acetylglucosaminyl-diphospho-decaprenol L-rhamnosyltransferase
VQRVPELSISIVLYNSAGRLSACLESISREVSDGFAELCVVDNASPDDSVRIVAEHCPGAVRIDAGSNRGFAAGQNLARPHVRGRYWLLLNPDVVVPEGGLRTLVAWMDRHPTVGAASPEIESVPGAPRSPGQRFPSVLLSLLEMSRLHLLLSESARGRLLRGAYGPRGDELDLDWVPATALVVRREAAEAAGPLAEDFFMYGEDIEWCWRIHRAGWQVGVCGAVAFVHHEASSSNRTWGTDETRRRIARGTCAACRRIRGRLPAAAFAVTQAAALAIESWLPHRPAAARASSRAMSRAYLDALAGV